MNTKKVEVTVYTQTETIQGSLEMPFEARLSDFLNNKSPLRSEFIAMHDVSLVSSNGSKELMKSVYINKNHIKMITIQQPDFTRGMGAQEGPKQYPYVQKYPIKANLTLQGFELSGNLHCNHSKEITAIFDSELTFIPCTDVAIYEENVDSRWRTDFASINKNFVHCIKEK